MNGRAITRRDFAALTAGAALVRTEPALGQGTGAPTVGVLGIGSAASFAPFVDGLRRGLAEAGFVEGRNVILVFRWAEDRHDRLAPLAAELASLRVAAIVATGGNAPALAAKSATATIPIVFTAVADPVRDGLVASLNRPGGNLTGVSAFTSELDSKRLELLHEVAPASAAIGVLINPNRPAHDTQLSDIERSAAAIGRKLAVARASAPGEIEAAFAFLVSQRIGALLVGADAFLSGRRAEIVALAARHRLPGIYQWRDFAVAGGLMSYGSSLVDSYRQAGAYVGRILSGDKPAELPVLQPTKFELVINLRTAKTLGVAVPPTLLARADEVIE